MERFKFDIDSNAIELENRKLADKLLKETIIIDIVKELNINYNTIINNPYPLLEFYKSQKDCINCMGLDYCKKPLKGMHDYLDQDYEIYLKPCNIKIANDHKYKYKKNIVINYINDTFKDTSLETTILDKNNKEELLVILSLKDWIVNPTYPGFYICGPYGTGKTHLLCAIINDLAKRNYKTGYIYTIDFVIKMRELNFDKNSYLKELDKIKNIDILAFDDIGAERMTDWARDELFMPILNYRMENKLITLFSSNESIESLRSKLSNVSNDDIGKDRLMERIKTLAKEISLDGKSKR